MVSRPLEASGLGAARALLSLAPVLWGLVLLGGATWLLRRHEPAAALPCLVFSGGYFWFAWSLFRDSTWRNESDARHPHESTVFERRVSLREDRR